MLSRIFKRGSKGEEESSPLPSTPGKFDEMAVRRSSRIASAQGTPVSDAGSPAIAKKRSAEATASPITQKRQRKLPVRNKDGENDGESHSHFEIVMPLKDDNAGSVANNEAESDGAENEDEQKAINDSQAEESDEEPEEEVAEEKSSKSKSKPGKTNSTKKPSPKPAAAASKPKHKRFGSEEPALDVPAIVEEVAEESGDESGEEEEDSDDDAPEEVGAQEATQAAQKLSRKAAKAAEEKEAELRKKRKDKDTLLKKQAEKKRRAEEALNDVGPQITRQDSKTSDPSTATLTKDPRPVPLNAKFDRSTLPEYLPAEFLEDEDTLMLDEPAQVSLPRPRKIKFSDVYEKKPKDRTVGSTTVRVAEKADKHLAPKAAKNARSTKEAWLAGRSGRGGGGGDNRRPVSGGFFKNGPAKR